MANTKQTWEIGQPVKVGFMTLTVRAKIATPGDYQPDAYVLSNAAGTQLYKFVPHNGLTKTDASEVAELRSAEQAHAERVAARAIAAARQAAINDLACA